MSYRDQLIDAEELIEELEKKNKGLEATLERVKTQLSQKQTEFTESERTHKESFISHSANSREAMLDYFEMGRAVGVLNMIKWVQEALK